MTRKSAEPTGADTTSEDSELRALRMVALIETVSFFVLITCSVLKRTTSFNAVPVMGSLHGALFIGLIVLVLLNRTRLSWGWVRTGLVLTIGSPLAHFFVRRAAPRPGV